MIAWWKLWSLQLCRRNVCCPSLSFLEARLSAIRCSKELLKSGWLSGRHQLSVSSPSILSWFWHCHHATARFGFWMVHLGAKLKHQSWKLSLCCLSAANWMELLCHFHHLWSFYMKVQCVPYKKTSPNELLVFHDCSVACKSPGWKPLYPCGRIFEIIWTPK